MKARVNMFLWMKISRTLIIMMTAQVVLLLKILIHWLTNSRRKILNSVFQLKLFKSLQINTTIPLQPIEDKLFYRDNQITP